MLLVTKKFDRTTKHRRKYDCYSTQIHLIKSRITWEEALIYCKANFSGGMLRIESEADQEMVRWKLINYSMENDSLNLPVWLGLQQIQFLGFWVWTSTGYSVCWSNWVKLPELPLSHPCGAIGTRDDNFKWSDQNCLSKLHFLCEGDKL
uniref:C-type lectin domain-containing protein n=1 Tax=Scleropages formosus TaxID=113540 RepID=A0A8C9RM44_SCLFO